MLLFLEKSLVIIAGRKCNLINKNKVRFSKSFLILVRGYLLDLFAKESEAHVRRALCDLIIQVLLLSETWPQLYQFIVSLCQDNGEIHKDGLYLLGEFCVNDESVHSSSLLLNRLFLRIFNKS